MRNLWRTAILGLTLAWQPLAATAQQPPQPVGAAAPPVYTRAVFNPYPAITPSPNAPSQYAAKPPISPYLNLLRGGELAASYYLDVVPMLQRQKKLEEPAFTPPRIDPKLDLEFKEMSLRKSTTGNLPSFGNYYGAYALPNNRGYIPYAPPTAARPVGQ